MSANAVQVPLQVHERFPRGFCPAEGSHAVLQSLILQLQQHRKFVGVEFVDT